MTIRLYRENGSGPHLEYYQKAASETFTFNDVVGINTSGYITKFVAGSAFPIVGLIQRTIAATASDYALTTRVPVLVASVEAEYLMDVDTGSAAQTDVGEYCDLVDHNGINVGASSNNDVYVTQVISASQVVAKFVNKVGDIQE